MQASCLGTKNVNLNMAGVSGTTTGNDNAVAGRYFMAFMFTLDVLRIGLPYSTSPSTVQTAIFNLVPKAPVHGYAPWLY